MIYRLAKLGDEDELLKMISTVLGGYGLLLEPEGADEDVIKIKEYYFDNEGWFQVVEDQGKIIGSIAVYRINEEICELRKMYIYEEYQGKKIGKRLLENAIEVAKNLGYKKIELQTNSRLVKAIPLYEKYGFVYNDAEVCSRCDISMIKIL